MAGHSYHKDRAVTTIAFFNGKSGGGKTLLVYHLAQMYAHLDVSVLAADLNPQANLTRMFFDEQELEPFWPDRGERRTVYGALRPLLEGTGDVTEPHLAEPDPGLGLVVGDLRLATAEDAMAGQWSACLDRKPQAFRVLSALTRILQRGARAMGAQVILADVGSGLGGLARAALLAADAVVVPMTPDLRSLECLRNLGPTIRRWQCEWRARRERNPVKGLGVPKGAMLPLGYIVMQNGVRFDRSVSESGRWMTRIPVEYQSAVMPRRRPTSEMLIGDDPNCLAVLRYYLSLLPLALEARKPLFALKAADGAVGGHVAAVQGCYRDFKALARTIAERVGIESDLL